MRKTKFFILTTDTTPEDLKKQYRVLSMKYHPDRPTGNHALFAEMNIEYHNLLKDLAQSAEKQKDIVEQSNISFQIEKHLQNILFHIDTHQSLYTAIYQEIKQPLITLFPTQYQPFIEDFVSLIEKHTKKEN